MKIKCRFCDNKINKPFLDLGFSPPSNNYLKKSELIHYEIHYPLIVYFCPKCYLVQNPNLISKNDLFDSNYHYLSSFSSSWLEHCKKYTSMITKRLKLNKKSKIIEVASNDGTLISYFDKSFNVLGVEPTSNTAKIAKSKGLNIYQNFLTYKNASEILKIFGYADLVIGNNVLAHVPDINDFIRAAKKILSKNGTINFEFPHLYNLLKLNQFDTIYHEHYSYISLIFIKKLLRKNKLKLYDVEEISTHGGSLRVYICNFKNNAYKINNQNILKVINKEKKLKLSSKSIYLNFAKKIKNLKKEINKYLYNQVSKNKKIYAYSAPAKASTVINYFGIDNSILEGIFDKSHLKIDKYTPGKHIKIYNPNKIKKYKPDILIIFAWNIMDEIKSQLAFTKKWDCELICLIPELTKIK